MLKIFTGNKLENLLTRMDDNICRFSGSPLLKVPVCIQTPGMQRWIGLELARHKGISANIDFIFPGALMKRLAGVKAGSKADWLEKDELTWRVFDRLQRVPDTHQFADITSYLSDDTGLTKSFRLARRIADVFDQYQVYRPEMVLSWLSPRPQLPKDTSDHWQPELFRSIYPDRRECKTVIYDELIKSCQKGYSGAKTPIHIFGISVLPIFFIEVLKAVAQHVDIYFYLLNPSRQYWGDSLSAKDISKIEKWTGKSAEELLLGQNHELLDNLGTIGRDFFDHLAELGEYDSEPEDYTEIDSTTILSTIHADILDLKKSCTSRENDSSIVINSCHNPLREIETLYDQLLDIFNSDSTIKPSDILVMTPDIETYSPYIKAVFDNPYSERETIPYSIADLSEKRSSKPASIYLELIETIRGDFSLASVVRLLGYEPVSDKFGINTSDVSSIAEMMLDAGAYWGYGEEHLQQSGLNIQSTFTWERALRRVSIGLAEGNTHAVYADAAAEGISFSLAPQIGGLMRFTELAEGFASEMQSEKTIDGWCEMLQNIADQMLRETFENTDDILHLNKCITDILIEASKGSFTAEIPFEPVLERLTEKLNQPRGAKGFMSGRVTFCAMLPMRSIPFRVICIAGLNEGTFPRQKESLEFDLTAKNPERGDRNNRDSDRYLFLETLISAKEKLILSYTGQSERDNQELPPSTLITELTTHLSSCFGIGDITTKHKLHSFSLEYFKGDKLFTYSSGKYETAKALTGKKHSEEFCTSQLTASEPESVTLAQFERFFVSPTDYFLKNAMGINTKIYETNLPETEIMLTDNLLEHNLTETAISECLSGREPELLLEYLRATAHLPPENLGIRQTEETSKNSRATAEKALKHLGGTPESVNIETEVNGMLISGSISGVHSGRHVFINPSSPKAKYIIRAWIRHLLLNRIEPTSTTIICGDKSMDLPPADQKHLSELSAIFKEGQKRPLRFHITDAMQNYQDSLIIKPKEDRHACAREDRAFHLCFGSDMRMDSAVEKIILRPLLRGGA